MRADKFFAEKFGSRTKAHDALEKGLVLLNGRPVAPKDEIAEGGDFTFSEDKETYVSRGGFKLARGLDTFKIDVKDRVFADFGASTGGFTDCLLQRGARRVYCVDVGKSQLDGTLAASPRVVVMDETNARYLSASDFPEPIDGVVADLSFISLRLILPAVCGVLRCGGEAYLLFKPQFESEGKWLGKSGIVPTIRHEALLRRFYADCVACGLMPFAVVNAPVRPKKNVEYVVALRRGGNALSEAAFLASAAKIF